MEENRLFNNWKRALILSLKLPNRTDDEFHSSMNEMSSLSYSLGGKVVGETIQTRSRVDSGYFFGKGKIKEIKSKAISRKKQISKEEADKILKEENEKNIKDQISLAKTKNETKIKKTKKITTKSSKIYSKSKKVSKK